MHSYTLICCLPKNSNFHQVFPLCCSFMQFSLSTAKQKNDQRKRGKKRGRERGESSSGDSSSALMSQKRCQRSFRSSSRAKQHSIYAAHTQADMQANYFTHTRTERAPSAHAYALPHTHAHCCTQLSPKSLPHSSFACCDVHARASFYMHVCVRACVCCFYLIYVYCTCCCCFCCCLCYLSKLLKIMLA